MKQTIITLMITLLILIAGCGEIEDSKKNSIVVLDSEVLNKGGQKNSAAVTITSSEEFEAENKEIKNSNNNKVESRDDQKEFEKNNEISEVKKYEEEKGQEEEKNQVVENKQEKQENGNEENTEEEKEQENDVNEQEEQQETQEQDEEIIITGGDGWLGCEEGDMDCLEDKYQERFEKCINTKMEYTGPFENLYGDVKIELTNKRDSCRIRMEIRSDEFDGISLCEFPIKDEIDLRYPKEESCIFTTTENVDKVYDSYSECKGGCIDKNFVLCTPSMTLETIQIGDSFGLFKELIQPMDNECFLYTETLINEETLSKLECRVPYNDLAVVEDIYDNEFFFKYCLGELLGEELN